MRRYETFNPTIPDESEPLHIDTLTRYEEKKEENKAPSSKPATRAKTSAKKPKKDSSSTTPGFFSSINNFFHSNTLRWLVGLFMAFFAVYLGIAFLSYFTTCINDQSEINNTPIGMSADVSNAGGEAGARLSEFLINEFFGVGSFVIIVWLLAVGLKLITGKPRFKFVNFTIKCLVAFITLSLIMGLFTLGMQSSVNWGGYHGRYVNEFIIHFVGWIGAVLLCIFMVAVFFVICLRDLLKWVMKKKGEWDEKRRIKKAEAEAQRAKELELEQMRLAEDKGEENLKVESSFNDDDLPEEYDTKVTQVHFGEPSNEYYSDIPELEEMTPVENQSESISGEESKSEEMPDLTEHPHSAYMPKEIDGENTENPADNYELREEEIHTTPEIYRLPDDEVKGMEDIETYPIPETYELPDNKTEKAEEEETKAEGEGTGEELKMKVNVNSISQVNVKNGGLNNDSPAHFPYKFPSFNILRPGATNITIDADEQLENKEKIRRTLQDFDIPIVSIEATIGPTVTLYEIVPDKGIRISRIKVLADDIAMSLSAENGVRIIAPIPGKGSVGIEVANKVKQTVSMQTVLKSPAFQNSKAELPLALGSTISNDVYVDDLASMPHLLVAGATGQGKSVGLNAIVASLLYSKRPDELKFVMIDPKMVEFSLYAKIEGHYLAKLPDAEDSIITDMDKVVATLNSLCVEMDNRYQLLKDAATRKITEYNEKFLEHRLNPESGHRFLPYIVVIVDEFSDLIMTAGRDVETPIARLAQKARAVGIHVILATQRPSANVITGIIKANFPTRIAFKVSSGVDSKTILDATGAQQLIGKGDMLVSHNGPMVRVQCAFIDTPEVEQICEHIQQQPYAQGAYLLPEPPSAKGDSDNDGGFTTSDRDPLFEEVARLVVHSNNASTSSLQRRYSIGYNRAGKIMDQLEAAGIVGPAQGGKPRTVLMDPVNLDILLESI